MKQIPLPIGPAPEPDFHNYLPGGNAAALQHLRTLAMPAAPVYLWGPSGSGKTHLLRGLAASCQSQGQRVGWFDADDALPWTLQPGWAAVAVASVGAAHAHADARGEGGRGCSCGGRCQ